MARPDLDEDDDDDARIASKQSDAELDALAEGLPPAESLEELLEDFIANAEEKIIKRRGGFKKYQEALQHFARSRDLDINALQEHINRSYKAEFTPEEITFLCEFWDLGDKEAEFRRLIDEVKAQQGNSLEQEYVPDEELLSFIEATEERVVAKRYNNDVGYYLSDLKERALQKRLNAEQLLDAIGSGQLKKPQVEFLEDFWRLDEAQSQTLRQYCKVAQKQASPPALPPPPRHVEDEGKPPTPFVPKPEEKKQHKIATSTSLDAFCERMEARTMARYPEAGNYYTTLSAICLAKGLDYKAVEEKLFWPSEQPLSDEEMRLIAEFWQLDGQEAAEFLKHVNALRNHNVELTPRAKALLETFETFSPKEESAVLRLIKDNLAAEEAVNEERRKGTLDSNQFKSERLVLDSLSEAQQTFASDFLKLDDEERKALLVWMKSDIIKPTVLNVESLMMPLAGLSNDEVEQFALKLKAREDAREALLRKGSDMSASLPALHGTLRDELVQDDVDDVPGEEEKKPAKNASADKPRRAPAANTESRERKPKPPAPPKPPKEKAPVHEESPQNVVATAEERRRRQVDAITAASQAMDALTVYDHEKAAEISNTLLAALIKNAERPNPREWPPQLEETLSGEQYSKLKSKGLDVLQVFLGKDYRAGTITRAIVTDETLHNEAERLLLGIPWKEKADEAAHEQRLLDMLEGKRIDLDSAISLQSRMHNEMRRSHIANHAVSESTIAGLSGNAADMPDFRSKADRVAEALGIHTPEGKQRFRRYTLKVPEEITQQLIDGMFEQAAVPQDGAERGKIIGQVVAVAKLLHGLVSDDELAQDMHDAGIPIQPRQAQAHLNTLTHQDTPEETRFVDRDTAKLFADYLCTTPLARERCKELLYSTPLHEAQAQKQAAEELLREQARQAKEAAEKAAVEAAILADQQKILAQQAEDKRKADEEARLREEERQRAVRELTAAITTAEKAMRAMMVYDRNTADTIAMNLLKALTKAPAMLEAQREHDEWYEKVQGASQLKYVRQWVNMGAGANFTDMCSKQLPEKAAAAFVENPQQVPMVTALLKGLPWGADVPQMSGKALIEYARAKRMQPEDVLRLTLRQAGKPIGEWTKEHGLPEQISLYPMFKDVNKARVATLEKLNDYAAALGCNDDESKRMFRHYLMGYAPAENLNTLAEHLKLPEGEPGSFSLSAAAPVEESKRLVDCVCHAVAVRQEDLAKAIAQSLPEAEREAAVPKLHEAVRLLSGADPAKLKHEYDAQTAQRIAAFIVPQEGEARDKLMALIDPQRMPKRPVPQPRVEKVREVVTREPGEKKARPLKPRAENAESAEQEERAPRTPPPLQLRFPEGMESSELLTYIHEKGLSFANFLKQWHSASGGSQNAFAQAIGLDRAQYAKLAAGEAKKPPFLMMKQLAERLGAPEMAADDPANYTDPTKIEWRKLMLNIPAGHNQDWLNKAFDAASPDAIDTNMIGYGRTIMLAKFFQRLMDRYGLSERMQLARMVAARMPDADENTATNIQRAIDNMSGAQGNSEIDVSTLTMEKLNATDRRPRVISDVAIVSAICELAYEGDETRQAALKDFLSSEKYCISGDEHGKRISEGYKAKRQEEGGRNILL